MEIGCGEFPEVYLRKDVIEMLSRTTEEAIRFVGRTRNGVKIVVGSMSLVGPDSDVSQYTHIRLAADEQLTTIPCSFIFAAL